MNSGKLNILIVDDEPDVRALLRAGLAPEGFEIDEAGSGKEAQDKIRQRAYDLVTLDLKLGGEDGLEIARALRATRNTPIIMITGKGDAVDRIVGLELGADDYIPKPFVIREVVARVRAVLRRYSRGDEARSSSDHARRFRFEGWQIDLDRREVLSPIGAVCELTTMEFNLLAYLAARPGRVMSRDDIMDALKGHDWTPMDRSIDALVARLRKKIEPESERPRVVKTVRGVGYVFAAEVERA